MHQSERAFRAHAKGQQVRRRAGLTGSCCRGAGHDEGRKRVRKGFQGRIFLSACCRFCPGTAYIVPLLHLGLRDVYAAQAPTHQAWCESVHAHLLSTSRRPVRCRWVRSSRTYAPAPARNHNVNTRGSGGKKQFNVVLGTILRQSRKRHKTCISGYHMY